MAGIFEGLEDRRAKPPRRPATTLRGSRCVSALRIFAAAYCAGVISSYRPAQHASHIRERLVVAPSQFSFFQIHALSFGTNSPSGILLPDRKSTRLNSTHD